MPIKLFYYKLNWFLAIATVRIQIRKCPVGEPQPENSKSSTIVYPRIFQCYNIENTYLKQFITVEKCKGKSKSMLKTRLNGAIIIRQLGQI